MRAKHILWALFLIVGCNEKSTPTEEIEAYCIDFGNFRPYVCCKDIDHPGPSVNLSNCMQMNNENTPLWNHPDIMAAANVIKRKVKRW